MRYQILCLLLLGACVAQEDSPCQEGWTLSEDSDDEQCIPLDVGVACSTFRACPADLICAYPTVGEQGLCLATCAAVDGDCGSLGDGQFGDWQCEPMVDGPKVCFYVEHEDG